MKKIENMTLGEFAAFVQSHLRENEIECILSGGACVSIYTENRYQSFDLDFIENFSTNTDQLEKVMKKLNFIKENRYFKHQNSTYFVEFPPGPLSIGDEAIFNYNIMIFETGELKLLTPTDCVRDRLCAYYYWNDLQTLDQAVMVSKKLQVDLEIIKQWSALINQENKYLTFKEKVDLY